MTGTDRIEKQVLLRAPLARVWRAISEASEFGSWFGIEFDAPFAPGATVPARIVPTKADPEIAKKQEAHAGTPFVIMVDRIEPMSLFSFRWHPGVSDPGEDEPTTLVRFELEERPEGTLLTITESGFDDIPLARRAEAFESNEYGWTLQTTLIAKYLEQNA